MPYRSIVRDTSARPENALLLCCARAWTDTESTAQIEALLQHNLDWEYLLRMAQRHALLPLLFWHLNTTCPEAVPSAPWQHLREHFHTNARHNLRLTGELLKLLRLLATHDIPALPFKGPVLAMAVYGDLALRQFVDLDLLVHPQDVLQVKTLFRTHGYHPVFSLTDAQVVALLQRYHEYPFVHQDGVGSVDLHWALHPRSLPTPLDSECMWERLEPVVLGGQKVLTFAPEETLVHLCIHGTRHLWCKLQLLGDVARLLGTYGSIDWERVMVQAHALGSARMLYLGLRLACDLLDVTLPKEVWRRVQDDPVVPGLAARVRTRLFRDTPAVLEGWQSAWFYIGAMEIPGRHRRVFCDTLCAPTPADFAFVLLPASLFPLYSVLRPLRLSSKYARRLLRRCLGP